LPGRASDNKDEDNEGFEMSNRKAKKNNNQLLTKGIYAMNVIKKLPWMLLDNLPAEFIEDIKNKKNP